MICIAKLRIAWRLVEEAANGPITINVPCVDDDSLVTAAHEPDAEVALIEGCDYEWDLVKLECGGIVLWSPNRRRRTGLRYAAARPGV